VQEKRGETMRKMLVFFVIVGILVGALPVLAVCEDNVLDEDVDFSGEANLGDDSGDPIPCGGGGGSGGGGHPG
jgi:hypothetical protein